LDAIDVLQANNRGFISAAKMYEAGEELTFDYGLVNPEVKLLLSHSLSIA